MRRERLQRAGEAMEKAEADLLLIFSHNGGFRLSPQMWRWYEKESPGGPMMTLEVHPAKTLQYLLGSLQSVPAFFDLLCLQTEIIDVGAAVLRFESGALAYLGSNSVTPWLN